MTIENRWEQSNANIDAERGKIRIRKLARRALDYYVESHAILYKSVAREEETVADSDDWGFNDWEEPDLRVIKAS